MASTKQKPQPRKGELPEEFQLRRTVAKLQLIHAKAALSTYAAADKGRRNRDWRANNGSADLAIIPDAPTLQGRIRQMVRDNWVASSVVRAYVRNIVGKSIEIAPHAKDLDGAPLTALNRIAQLEYHKWSRSKDCDVERKQTFAQKQRLAVGERATVGEHLLVWSYQTPLTPNGRIDKSKPAGLKLQSFEPEQFDLRILSYEGREVRGGVEVDEGGAAVAYHLYLRNPTDYLYRYGLYSKRIDRERVIHYFKQERVLQTRGVSPIAPVLQDMRDLSENKGAVMMRTRLEACIGAIIKRPAITSAGFTPLLAPNPGDSTTTSSGMRLTDFTPGMVAELLPGEDISFNTPQSPGSGYEPFTTLGVRGIGAGTGMSFGQVMRQADGNYSSARQDMLEDRKEWEPEQELLVDDLIRPLYEKWFNFAALEGRFDGVEGFTTAEYLADPSRFHSADYIPPAQTWIDPEKEANGYAVMLKNRLITREEIVAARGGRFYQTISKLAAEKAETDDLGLGLPENEMDRSELRNLVQAFIADRQGTLANVVANNTDMADLLEDIGLPLRPGYTTPWLPVVAPQAPLVSGEEVKDPDGNIIGGNIEAPTGGMPVAPGAVQGPQVKPPQEAKMSAVGVRPTLDRQVLTWIAEHAPTTIGELCRKFGLERNTLAPIFDRLESANLINKGNRGFGPTTKGKRLAHGKPGMLSAGIESQAENIDWNDTNGIAMLFNENHDDHGKFSSGGGGGGGSSHTDHPLRELHEKWASKISDRKLKKSAVDAEKFKSKNPGLFEKMRMEVIHKELAKRGIRVVKNTSMSAGYLPVAPNYALSVIPDMNCGSCSFNVGGHCSRYDFDIDPAFVCDSWAAFPVGPETPGNAKVMPPGKMDGERGIDRDFQPDARTTPLP